VDIRDAIDVDCIVNAVLLAALLAMPDLTVR
jgi:hypothetical protein